VKDKLVSILAGERLEINFNGDTLVKGIENGPSQSLQEVRLSNQDKECRRKGVKIEIGKELKLEEVFVSQEMGIIQNNDGNSFFMEGHVHDGLLDGAKEDVFFVKNLAAEKISQLTIEIGDRNRSQWSISHFKKFFLQRFHKGAE
jgi:hypothetical protein